ncbi:hypothetical protein HPT25_26450 [Bacillus sp. BRMEA1]|uniref:hypothetical protein n=1 Tax=Neobacillus endophyticus TaxID=2738405 RepID=UPI001563C214|nr:hypothetical protein [Neobacillus endophyticus]NRD80873.1 hypothetical protein [Neobacillus endophyticus]
MVHYDNELLTDLEKGNVYSARDIAEFLKFKQNVTILCSDTDVFNSDDANVRFKVRDKLETFIHSNNIVGYIKPNVKSLIYIVEKV